MTLPPLPPGVKLIQNGVDAFRLVLPRRTLGKFRWIGLAPLIFGLGICGFAATWMSGPFRDMSHAHGIDMAFPIAFGLLMLPGLLMGLGLIMLGLSLIKNWTYAELVVNRRHIRNIEHFGICRWSWKTPTPTLEALSIGRGMSPDTGGDLGAAHFEQENGPGLTFAAGYSMSLLRPVAENIAHLLDQSRIAPSFKPKVYNSDTDERDEASDLTQEAELPSSGKPAASTPRSAARPWVEKEPAKPATTDITILPQPRGIAISIPPAGFKGAARIMTIIGAIFAVFPGLLLIPILSSSEDHKLAPIAFIGIFVIVGVAMLLAGINIARQRFLLAVAEDKLALRRVGIFGTKEQLVTRPEISAIHIGASGVTVNNVPVMELQVERRNGGSTIGALSNRSNEEIEWIASLLRKAMKVGNEPWVDTDGLPDEAITQPPKSKIIIQKQEHGYAITVPPTGVFRGASVGLLVFGAIFAGIPTVLAIGVINNNEGLGILLFLSIFVSIGVAAVLYAIKTGRQRVLIAVTPDQLAYQRTSPFGTSKQHYQRPEITAIGIGPSGASVNNKPIPELKIQVAASKWNNIGLLQGYTTEELRWLAAVLRTTLKVDKINEF